MSKKQHNIKPGLYCSEDGESLVEVVARYTSMHSYYLVESVVPVCPTLRQHTNHYYVVFNQLFPTKVNGVRVDPLVEVSLSEELFASLYPARVVGYRVDLGEGFATTVEQDKLYCSYRNAKIIVRVIKEYRSRYQKTKCIAYRQLYPSYEKDVLTCTKSLFLYQYPCLVTGCVLVTGCGVE